MADFSGAASNAASSSSATSDSARDDEHQGGQGPPRRKRSKLTGRYKSDWTLPKFITSSSKNNKLVYCKLCCCELSVAHGGINDIKRHTDSLKHRAKLKQAEPRPRL